MINEEVNKQVIAIVKSGNIKSAKMIIDLMKKMLNMAAKKGKSLKEFIEEKKPTTVKELVKKGKVETLELNDLDFKGLKRELNKNGVKFSIKKKLAVEMEIYVKGSLNVFNHRTNVDTNNRVVCYDIKELGKQLKKIGMLIIQDQVWNRVTINRTSKKATRYFVDEFHLLLKEPQTANYSIEIWKRFRKWGGMPTGLTQNIKDLLASPEIENIFDNTDFILMLNQAGTDRDTLAKKLNISKHQLSYVTNSNEGEGLIFYGNTIVPFIDRFPKNTKLYSLITTKLSETGKDKK